MRGGRGFTLIELLVAMAVFSVLAVLAYGGLNTMLNSRAIADQQAEELRALQLAYRLVERDIDQWVPRDVRDEFGETRLALDDGSNVKDANNIVLELTRGGWRNPAEQPRSTLQRVAYSVQDNTLSRLTWLNLDRALNDQAKIQELLSGVRELRIRYLARDNTWRERLPVAVILSAPLTPPVSGEGTPAATPPPRAMEWVLVTERWGELRWLFRFPE